MMELSEFELIKIVLIKSKQKVFNNFRNSEEKLVLLFRYFVLLVFQRDEREGWLQKGGNFPRPPGGEQFAAEFYYLRGTAGSVERDGVARAGVGGGDATSERRDAPSPHPLTTAPW